MWNSVLNACSMPNSMKATAIEPNVIAVRVRRRHSIAHTSGRNFTGLRSVPADVAGGADPDDGFDCSGLVWYSYREAGLKLPRSAAAQRKGGRAIKFSQARPGDLLFYRFNDRKPGDLHVVIYLGDDEAVHARVRHGEVDVIKDTARHWRDRFVGATRYIREE